MLASVKAWDGGDAVPTDTAGTIRTMASWSQIPKAIWDQVLSLHNGFSF